MKLREKEFFLLLSIFCVIKFRFAKSVCEINYPHDVETSPIYAKVLGEFTVYLPYNGKTLLLNNDESIQAFCRTNFTSIPLLRRRMDYWRGYDDDLENADTELSNATAISLKCVHNQLHYNDFILEQNVLSCNRLNWSIYSTKEPYDWCEKIENSKTFLLAAKSSNDHHILAGICFNLMEWSLQTITYNITNCGKNIDKETQRDITKTHLKGFQSLGDELSNLKSNYFDFTELDLHSQLAELSNTYSWLILANYEMASIIQGKTFKEYFKEFSDTLNIIWWRNLRLGNWKNFFKVLENYANNNSFQVYAGTSGAVKIPSTNSGENNILELQNVYLNKTVPGYIWSYLTSTDGKNEDFIIVGYNSPFAEWFGINEIVFCPDVCSQIGWLKEITSTFRFASAGVMFCCSPDFVRQTNFLHGFPMDVLLARSPRQQINLLEIVNSTDLETLSQKNTEEAAANTDSINTLLDI